MVGIESEIHLLAADCVCYCQINSIEDISKLLKNIDQLDKWARKWATRFQPMKCNIMQLIKKQIKKINAVYSLEGTVLKNIDNIKYLGETILNTLEWQFLRIWNGILMNVSTVCTKANRTLGFSSYNLSSCPKDVKETLYKGLVWPILEYTSPVWDPHGIVVQEELETVQNRAARFMTETTTLKL